jgi:F0F1-type ATP synthase delta subunit
MRAIHYAKVMYALTAGKPVAEQRDLVDQVIEAARERRNGHLLPKILRAYERIAAREEARGTIIVATADPITEARAMEIIRSDVTRQIIDPTHRRVVRTVDPTLVGGFVVRTRGWRVDASYRRALTDLYRRLSTFA